MLLLHGSLLETNGFLLTRAICVQKPYLERRVRLTFQKQWPGCDFLLSSPPIPYEGYAQSDIIDFDKLLNDLVGQGDRVGKYPALGFTEKTSLPEEVIAAKRQLVAQIHWDGGWASFHFSGYPNCASNAPTEGAENSDASPTRCTTIFTQISALDGLGWSRSSAAHSLSRRVSIAASCAL
jgi:hypothetical protein